MKSGLVETIAKDNGKFKFGFHLERWLTSAIADALTAPLAALGYVKQLKASKTHNLASIAAAGTETTTVAAVGAVVGDVVLVSSPINTGGLIINGFVSAADVVTIVAHNATAAAVDLASTTFDVVVIK